MSEKKAEVVWTFKVMPNGATWAPLTYSKQADADSPHFILPASSVPSDEEIRDLFDEWVAAPGCTGCQRDFARVVLNHLGLTIGGE